MYSAKLVGVQMDEVFELYLPEYTVPAPEVQTNYKEVPFRNGAIDKTSPDGVVYYRDRDWDLVFKKTGEDVSADDLQSFSKAVMNAIHGRAGEIIFDDDASYKWIGRVFVTSVSCEQNGLLIVNVHLITQPYKYGINDIVVSDIIETEVDNYQGELVSFEFGIGKAMTSAKAIVNPIQDLNGYASPWAAGAGVNKAFWPTLTNTSSNGVDYSISDDLDTLHIEGTASSQSVSWASSQSNNYANMPIGPLPAGTYKITTTGFIGQDASDRIVFTARYADGTTISGANGQRLTSDSGVIPTGAGRTVTFTATDSFKIGLYLSINSGTVIDCDVKIQLEAANELGNWTPYANVCPITGRTRANVYRTGKNLCRVARGWGSAQGIVYTENADGTVHCKGTATGDSFSGGSITASASNIDSRCMYTVPAGTYTISNIDGVRIWVQFRNADNTAQIETSTSVSVGSSKTFTFAEPTIIYIRSYIATGTAVDADMHVMVTEGSIAATEYVPWQMQTVAEDWTSVAGTVYGGTLDAVSGELMQTMANIESYNGETIGEPWLSSMDAYAEGTTPTTGAQVVYTLATPVTYQLTPQQIELIENEINNIWQDSGDMSVEISSMDKVTLTNGSKPINPKIKVLSANNITLLFEVKGSRHVVSLGSGDWKVPDLILFEGDTDIYESGQGSIQYIYPEASL